MNPDGKKNWRQFQTLKPDRAQLSQKARRLELVTVRHAQKFLVQRWENVREVRRHMLGWLLLVGLLISVTGMQMVWNQESYMVEAAVPGGTYAEGVTGNIDTLNPIYASTNAERSASRLIFAPLLSYDRDGRLRGDLAENWSIDESGKKYTVNLRQNAVWHDGTPFTSGDVAFTIDRIKDIDARSPYYSSWQSVTVDVVNDSTVRFTLPAVYAPFPHALTIGLLPEHLLGEVEPAALRESSFSTEPVGTGPFSFRNIQNIDVEQGRKVVHLRANEDYFRGAPKLERFQLHTYGESSQLERALRTNEVSAVSDATAQMASMLADEGFEAIDAPVNNGAYALLRNDSEILKDVAVRRALQLGTDTTKIIELLDDRVEPLNGPLIGSQVADGLARPAAFDAKKANEALDKAGWVKNDDGTREKEGVALGLSVVSVESGDYPLVLEELARQWRELGIQVESDLVASEDVQQTVLRPRAYDVLLFELALGSDPDVYAYWHSSQASQNGLNFANYDSPIADDALESARTRHERNLRDEKYKTFVERWVSDAPAIPLYRAALHYVTAPNVRAIPKNAQLIDSIDRYRAVEYWAVERGRLYMTP